ncbi:MAG: DUF503 domain-containing protein [Bryobacteraceae bacterium]
MASIGVLTLELRIESSHSLKEKRHVVKSLKDRLGHRFNVAVAEIDFQDLWQRSMIAAVTVELSVGQPRRFCNRSNPMLQKFLEQCWCRPTSNG